MWTEPNGIIGIHKDIMGIQEEKRVRKQQKPHLKE